MSHDAVEFVLKAVEMVAEHGWKLLPQVHKKEKLCDNRKICEHINNHNNHCSYMHNLCSCEIEA